MKEKNKKVLICFAITLIVLILGILIFIVYGNLLNEDKSIQNSENKKTTTKVEESLINNVLPSDLSNYYQVLWDYEYLYNKYFTMKDNQNISEYLCFEDWCSLYNKFTEKETNNKNFKPYDFVKIENNKLYWNINGEWISDKKITNDIKLFYVDSFEEMIESFVVVTSDSMIYRITLETEFIKDDSDEYRLTNEIYNNYKYNKIDNLESISNVKFVSFPMDCDAQTLIYIEIANNIFVLGRDELINVEEFVKSYYKDTEHNYINELDNTCVPHNDIVNVNFDGTLYNIKNIENYEIKVKYYLKVTKEDPDYNINKNIDLIIDDKNNLYVIDRNKIKDITNIKTLEVFEKVKKINWETNENKESYIKNIELETNDKIILSK